jgi:hypothetical protein
MLWLMIVFSWCTRVILGGPSAAAPATRVLLYLLALLGVLQLLVTAIDILEAAMTVLVG